MLGVGHTQDAVKAALSLLGRSAQLPWMVSEIHELHPYLAADSLLLVPAAHTLLRGLIRSLLGFALLTTVAGLQAMKMDTTNHPVVFTAQQRRQVEVWTAACRAKPCTRVQRLGVLAVRL